MPTSLPRDRRRGTVLRPQFLTIGDAVAAWWVVDDLGPFDGPHISQDAAWSRIDEIYASDMWVMD